MNISIHPRTSIVDACFVAWKSGRHVKTVNGIPELAPGRDPKQVLTAFRCNRLLQFANDLRERKQ